MYQINIYILCNLNAFKFQSFNRNLLVLKDLELKELEDSNSFQFFNAYYWIYY
jgi:hypothetical protein